MKDTQLKVIIADSNVQDRESKQLSMESKGMEVILSTGDGNKVLRAVSDGKADVIVMDMIMSGLDGIGILEECSNMSGRKPIFIIQTALRMENLVEQAIKYGADYYMMKPVSNQMLIARVLQLVNKRYIRENGHLSRGSLLKNVKEYGNVFALQNATDILGIGTNMVKSLKYWMTATKLIEEKNREIMLSDFGSIINEYDPYLEDIFSWWLIHINMITNIDDAYIYNLFFNKCNIKTFTKRELYEKLYALLINEKLTFNENILQDEVNMIIKTYTIDEKIDNPENNFICPLSELNLLKKVDRDTYEKNRPEIRNLPFWVVYYIICLLLDDRDNISIDELLKEENSPAKLLNMDKNLINEYLDEMKKNDLIIINRTAGLNMVYLKKKLSLNEIAEEYFKGDRV